MKRLNRYYEAMQSVFNYFGLDKCNIIYPIIDCREYPWTTFIGDGEKLFIEFRQNGMKIHDPVVDLVDREDFTAILIEGIEGRYMGIFNNLRNREWNLPIVTSGGDGI